MEFRDDILYEPRAFWDVVSIAADSAEPPRVTFSAGNRHWVNSSRHTVVFDRAIFSAIGYRYREFNEAAPTGVTSYDLDLGVVNLFDWFLSAPFRVHFSRKDLPGWTFQQIPTGEPSMRYSDTAPFASGLWGTSRWDFNFPYWLPRKGLVQFDISSFLYPDIPTDPVNIPISIMFNETSPGHANRIPGTARITPRLSAAVLDTVAGVPATFPAGPAPTDPDPLGAKQGVATGINQAWPAATKFDRQVYRAQEAQRGGGRSFLTGFGVHIEQIEYDAQLIGVTDERMAPIAQQVITRAKSLNGGSNEWWWRPGAPLALVSPTLNNSSLVFAIDPPIVLGPGDNLEGEVQVPDPRTIPGVGTFAQTYNLGISFTGHAAIEG
jgi:hypothetical protein